MTSVFSRDGDALTVRLPAGASLCTGGPGCGGKDASTPWRKIRPRPSIPARYRFRTEGCTVCGHTLVVVREGMDPQVTLHLSGQSRPSRAMENLTRHIDRVQPSRVLPAPLMALLNAVTNPRWELDTVDDTEAQERVLWASCHWSPRDAQEARAAGLTADEAASWLGRGIEPGPAILRWWVAVRDPDVASDWVEAGVADPAKRPDGLSARDVHFLKVLGMPDDPRWAPRGRVVCPEVVRVGMRGGKDPTGTLDLALALRPQEPVTSTGDECWHDGPGRVAQYGCGWSEPASWTAREVLESLPNDVAWGDLAPCVRAGMGLDEAIAYVRSGADLGPVRVVAGLS